MTRRDYCKVCQKRVNDEDTCCSKCRKSICLNCIITYDAFSRLVKLETKLRSNELKVSFPISPEEFAQMITDLNSTVVEELVNKNYPEDDEYYLDVKTNFYLIRENLTKIYNENTTNMPFDSQMHLNTYLNPDIFLDEPFPFICKDCATNK